MARRAAKTEHEIMMGSEPEPQVITDTANSELIRSMYWYNVELDQAGYKQAVIEYTISKFGEDAGKLVSRLSEKEFTPTQASISRMVLNGWILPEITMERFHAGLESLIREAKFVREARSTNKTKRSPFEIQFDRLMSFLDHEIDQQMLDNKHQTELFAYMMDNNMTAGVGSKALKWLNEVLAEVSDPELCGNATKRSQKATIKFYEQLIKDCGRYVDSKKATRKKRKSRKKTTDVLAKFTYKERDADLELFSIDPNKILGAAVVVTYNTSLKQVSVYVSKGMNIRRSSIVDFDEEKSGTYRFRDLDAIRKIQKAKSANGILKIVKQINSKKLPATGRINKNSIIVTAR